MVDLKLLSGNSTSRVVPSPVTFSVRANRGDGVHSTSSKSSECGVPKDMKDGKQSHTEHCTRRPGHTFTYRHLLMIRWLQDLLYLLFLVCEKRSYEVQGGLEFAI